MPLMKRTVREESGAWSLLKKAAVRAKPAARSSDEIVWPKFPIDVVGAPGVSNTARTFPARSATATTMGAFTDRTAFCTTLVTSETLSGVSPVAAGADDDGPLGAGDDDPLPPPQDKHSRVAAQATRENPEPLKRGFLALVFVTRALFMGLSA